MIFTDHLGSVRVVFSGANNVSARNDYYAFGKRAVNSLLPAVNDLQNRWLYNGKESQTTGDLKFLDYGARMHDNEIGRWFNPDPLAEDYTPFSPYNYTLGNPINLIDPNGMSVITLTGQAAQDAFSALKSMLWNDSEKKEEEEEDEPSNWEYGIPVWGASLLADQAWENGEYFDWFGWIMMGTAEGVSLGLLALETQGMKTAALSAMRTRATTVAANAEMRGVINAGVRRTAGRTLINSADDLINAASGTFAPTKNAMHGVVKGMGSADDIFNSITKGGKITTDFSVGIMKATMPNGTHITRYISTGGWGPTIQVNTGAGLPYKIRIQ